MESLNIHKFLESEKFSKCIKLQLFALCITDKITMPVTFQNPLFLFFFFFFFLPHRIPL
jgi:hypothetical protein